VGADKLATRCVIIQLFRNSGTLFETCSIGKSVTISVGRLAMCAQQSPRFRCAGFCSDK
jgi:hypothetical protein